MKKILLALLAVPAIVFGQTYPSPTFSSLTLQNPLTVANGGTGAVTSTAARASLGAASSGSNSDITNLLGTMHSPTSPPASVCSGGGGYVGAFTCDLSNLDYAIGTQVSGSSTLGQPTTGYMITPNLHSTYTYWSSTSGWNQSTSVPDGRTGNGANFVVVDQLGQGDAWGAFYNIFVNGAKPGATSWLANPAGAMIAGQNYAGTDGVYLQGIGDINLNDNGHDVTGIPLVLNMSRTNNTAALGETWIGARIQSSGSTKNVDAFYSAIGPSKIGLDLVGMTGGNVGIALPPNIGIYLDGTNSGSFPNTIAPGNTEIVYNSGAAALQAIVGGAGVMNLSSSNITANVGVTIGASGNALNVTSSQASTSSATGAITTAGGIGVAGAVNIGGALSAAGNDSLTYTNSSAQSIPNNAATVVTGWTKVSDRVNANFNASTGIFTAPATACYNVSTQLVWAGTAGTVGGTYLVQVLVNGSPVIAGTHLVETTANTAHAANVSGVVCLTSGQTISIGAYQNSGSTVSLSTGNTVYLSINRIP
ncbi:hypothetical protein FEP54_05222 [Burkholderia multivorans]|uniref:hypothetical protein n=1 Tax=Burkholderia multivorans TaxID=87883 RepID=UPI00285FE4B2|nr:hypothetical protein [Burkholderia multivorans]MDR8915782.1 hypothetical protein [Burkholderia multivorans]MDR8926481.1 hypothetical protein [Burkholderia multivorans]MDR8964066.1 hypothetical protein [Burkholderia multivorans]MDR8989916.1 hypothetical protein [Burkholderia multivorans]MDR9019152.1 hypothetical protein [Burkholderia multivorans]